MARLTETFRVTARLLCIAALVLLLPDSAARAQAPAPAKPEEPAKVEKDALGRDTPRGTVLGFLGAARKDDKALARRYLDTRSTGQAADRLVEQLFVVLDARLPARLGEISDQPEGSRADPLQPNHEVVGTIESGNGNVDVIIERVERRGSPPVWLFSAKTLESVPRVYEEITLGWGDSFLTRLLTSNRFGGIRLMEWVTALLGLPILYFVAVLLNKLLTPPIRTLWRALFKRSTFLPQHALPTPIRLLLLAFAIRWFVTGVPLPLLVRQFWSNAAAVITIAAIAWLLILLNGFIEEYVRRRFPRANQAAGSALLRVLRRVCDLLVVFGAIIALLRYLGVDPTPALAGLGVGGIAVALAAQKTLENVIAGASLIFDQAVRVGDTLKMGEVTGTVEHIGLRSTRIRTPDRTLVTVPNGQIANVSLETLSARDKFWFHPIVTLRYETTPEQLHVVLDGIRRMLEEHSSVERESVRVRFIRLAASSLDVEVFAYLYARDWNDFLEMQEKLLFGITDVVARAGTAIAFPSQTMYVSDANAPLLTGSVPRR